MSCLHWWWALDGGVLALLAGSCGKVGALDERSESAIEPRPEQDHALRQGRPRAGTGRPLRSWCSRAKVVRRTSATSRRPPRFRRRRTRRLRIASRSASAARMRWSRPAPRLRALREHGRERPLRGCRANNDTCAVARHGRTSPCARWTASALGPDLRYLAASTAPRRYGARRARAENPGAASAGSPGGVSDRDRDDGRGRARLRPLHERDLRDVVVFEHSAELLHGHAARDQR